MRVLFATSECVPFYKRGGLGDVSHDLPIALSRLGADVSIVMPFYAAIRVDKVGCVGQLAVDWNGKRELVFVFRAFLAVNSNLNNKNLGSIKANKQKYNTNIRINTNDTNVNTNDTNIRAKKIKYSEITNHQPSTTNQTIPVYLLRHPILNEYLGKDIDETFAFFSLAASRMYLYLPHIVGGLFDIVHCHDWHTALIPLLLGETKKTRHSQKQAKTSVMKFDTLESQATKSVLTIHNLMYQGVSATSLIRKMGLPDSIFHPYESSKGSFIKIMREGCEYADIISTVSPTYAAEIVTPEYGEKLDDVLLRRRDKIVGILNGIDYDMWNPETDKALFLKYNSETVFSIKPQLKRKLQKELKLPLLDVPFFGFVGRLEPRQKGIDLIIESVDKMDSDIPYQLAILGTGDENTIRQIKKVQKKNHHIAFINAFDPDLAKRIYASSDFMLVPSRFEPCGLIQLIAMRYGAVPIVRKTGGLADSVEDGVTGLVFEKYAARDLTGKMKEAMELYSNKSDTGKNDRLSKMIRNAMGEDNSWDKSARKYVEMYRKLVRG